MSAALDDRRLVAANYAVATKTSSRGALCYVGPWAYFGDQRESRWERVEILARSRGGRWIRKVERIDRLTNFRLKTIPPEHPRYADERLLGWRNETQERVAHLRDLCEHATALRTATEEGGG